MLLLLLLLRLHCTGFPVCVRHNVDSMYLVGKTIFRVNCLSYGHYGTSHFCAFDWVAFVAF